MNRGEFLKTLGLGGIALAVMPSMAFAKAPLRDMPRIVGYNWNFKVGDIFRYAGEPGSLYSIDSVWRGDTYDEYICKALDPNNKNDFFKVVSLEAYDRNIEAEIYGEEDTL